MNYTRGKPRGIESLTTKQAWLLRMQLFVLPLTLTFYVAADDPFTSMLTYRRHKVTL